MRANATIAKAFLELRNLPRQASEYAHGVLQAYHERKKADIQDSAFMVEQLLLANIYCLLGASALNMEKRIDAEKFLFSAEKIHTTLNASVHAWKSDADEKRDLDIR